jgi:hypothetical protein
MAPSSILDDSPFLNNYTIIHVNEDGTLGHRAYAAVFEKELSPILAAFDALLSALEVQLEGTLYSCTS